MPGARSAELRPSGRRNSCLSTHRCTRHGDLFTATALGTNRFSRRVRLGFGMGALVYGIVIMCEYRGGGLAESQSQCGIAGPSTRGGSGSPLRTLSGSPSVLDLAPALFPIRRGLAMRRIPTAGASPPARFRRNASRSTTFSSGSALPGSSSGTARCTAPGWTGHHPVSRCSSDRRTGLVGAGS